MKNYLPLLCLGLAMGTMSCGGDTPPTSQGTTDNTMHAAGPAPAQSANPNRHLADEVPPPDAEFSIFCDVLRGPSHVLLATRLKEQMQAKGFTSTHLIHSDNQTMVFFGYYRTINDTDHFPKAEVEKAQADLRRIIDLKNEKGEKLFASPMFLPVDQPDPDAPPQWDLARTPEKAFWSLQIAAYQGSPDRKKYAVEAVLGLRAEGVEAYYYHGDTISSVCIGAWPETAIKRQDRASGGTADQDGIVMVTSQPLPPRAKSEMYDREGNRIIVQAPKLEVLEPALAAAIRKYPHHAVNGLDHKRVTKDGTEVFDDSFLVLVPHEHNDVPTPSIRIHNETAAGADTAANAILEGPSTQRQGFGRLPSVEQP